MASTRSAISADESDIRTDRSDIEQERANLRTTDQNLRTERQDLRTEQQDFRAEHVDARTDSHGLRDGGSGDLRADRQHVRVADNRFRDRDSGDRAWRSATDGRQAWRGELTASSLANNAAANESKSAATRELQQKWYRYAW